MPSKATPPALLLSLIHAHLEDADLKKSAKKLKSEYDDEVGRSPPLEHVHSNPCCHTSSLLPYGRWHLLLNLSREASDHVVENLRTSSSQMPTAATL